MANTMMRFVVAQFIEDPFVGDTVSVHGTLAKAVSERDKIMADEKSKDIIILRNLKVFKVTSEEVA